MTVAKKTRPINTDKPYFQEWLNSQVDPEIIDLNVKYIKGRTALEYLLGNALEKIGEGQKTPHSQQYTTTPVQRLLAKYTHVEDGGWWASGVDILKGFKESEWGCFKPDNPRLDNEKKKPIKYEHPPQQPTEIFALKVPDSIWKNISHHFECPIGKETSFWEWVLKNPSVPVVITEGAKKAGALLTAGYAAIALPGINNGLVKVGDSEWELGPHLKAFAQNGRQILFAFDADKKAKTQKAVKEAIARAGKLFKEEGCYVSVMVWVPEQGKGIDDVLASGDRQTVERIFEQAERLTEYIEKRTRKVRKFTTEAYFLDFLREEEIPERLRYNELTLEIELDGKVFEDLEYFKSYFADVYSVHVPENIFLNAITYFAKENSYHPVKDYLESLSAVTPISLDNLATRYFGLTSELDNKKLKRWLIGSVARVLSPHAIDFSAALILYGREQGMGKSRFFQTLGGDWHTDDIDELRGRDNALKQHRYWILEVAEFDQITNKKEAAQLKSWVSVKSDTFREPFGRKVKAYRRKFAIAATVNEIEILKDETGSRRFWILDTQDRPIDFNLLATERDGIWAAAVAAYKAGEKYWFDASELRELQDANKRFEVFDDWQGAIEGYCESHQIVCTADILKECFGITLDAPNYRQQQIRATKILTKLRFNKFRQFATFDDLGKLIRPIYWISQSLKSALDKGLIAPDAELQVFQNYEPLEESATLPATLPETTAVYYSRAETLATDTDSEVATVVPLLFEEKNKNLKNPETASDSPEVSESSDDLPPDPTDRAAVMRGIREEEKRIKGFNPAFNLGLCLKHTFPGRKNTNQLSDQELFIFWESIHTIHWNTHGQ